MNYKYIEIYLESGGNGYSAIKQYIYKYFDKNIFSDVIVRIGTSYDNVKWDVFNEFARFNANDLTIEFLNDWWEGETFIRIYGIVPIDLLDVSGGLYTN